jgi:hypothetical protein
MVSPDFLRDLKLSRVGLIVKRGPDDLRQGNSDLPELASMAATSCEVISE